MKKINFLGTERVQTVPFSTVAWQQFADANLAF